MSPFITRRSPQTPATEEEISSLRESLYESCTRGKALSIVSHPHFRKALPKLPAADVFYAIQEIGLKDATDVIAASSPSQVQAFLDLDIWVGDRVDLVKGLRWMEALESLTTGPFMRSMRELDPEITPAIIARTCRVYDLTLEEILEDPVEGPWTSPDSFYAVAPLSQELVGAYRVVTRFLDKIYSVSLALGKKTVMTARWEPIAELEENAYRWSSGRLQDLGFADFYESLQVYAPLKLSSLKLDEGRPDPAPASQGEAPSISLEMIAAGRGEDPKGSSKGAPQPADFFAKCLQHVEEAEDLTRLGHALARVANKLMAADRVNAPDLKKARDYYETTRRYVSLGLEYVTHGDPQAGHQALTNITLLRLFRAGYTLTWNLRRLVEKLRREGRLSLAPRGTTLLDPPWDELVRALCSHRPALVRHFDSPPREGTRPIAHAGDIRFAASLIEDLAMQWPLLFNTLGLSPALLSEEGLRGVCPGEPARVTLGDLFRTAFLNALTRRGLVAEPLNQQTLDEAKEALETLVDGGVSLITAAKRAIQKSAKKLGTTTPKRLERILGPWVAPLLDEWNVSDEEPTVPQVGARERLAELVLTVRESTS